MTNGSGTGGHEEAQKEQEPKPPPQESIVQRIGRMYGADTRVMLHDSPSDSGPLLPVTSRDEVPEDDSHYQILGQIAKGGVGVVYKARDKNLGREVALKVLRADRVSVKNVAERLVEEAQVGGQLQHPGIVPVYGLGMQKDGRPHFAMKLVKGVTVAELLADRKDPKDKLAKHLEQFEDLCNTMAYCHARGVIHRDLKPANVMVGSFGEVLVVDWGFGKVLGLDHRGRGKQKKDTTPAPESIIATLRSDSSGTESLAGSIMGTPAYMPPEQALGQVDELDERCDVFALGSVLCEILTGEPAYVGGASDMLVMAAQGRTEEAVERLDKCGANPALVELAKQCMAPVRKDRPANAGVLAERLRAHFSELETRARKAKVAVAKARANADELRAQLAAAQLKIEKERAQATKERIKSEQARASVDAQRREAEYERQRQRRFLLLAASILLVVVVGGGAYAYTSAGAEKRAANQEAAFSNSLRGAMNLAESRRWNEAVAAALGSLSLLPADAADRRSFVEDRIAQWRSTRVQEEKLRLQEEKDNALRTTLRALRDRLSSSDNPVDLDIAYFAAFKNYGITSADIPTSTATIAKSALKMELATALDLWTDLRRSRPQLKDREWRALVDLAQIADPDPVRQQIRTALVAKNTTELAHLASARNIEKQPAHTLVVLSNAMLSLRDAEGAVRILRRARNQYPADAAVNLHLALSLLQLTPPRPKEAARYMRAALAVTPESDAILTALAVTLTQAREWAGAATILRTLVARNPGDADVHARLAYALTQQGDLAGAQAAAEHSVSLAPASPSGWDTLLSILSQRADADAYLAKSEEAVKAFPNEPTFPGHKARALLVLGRFKEARETAESVRELAPYDVGACVTLAVLYMWGGEPSRAVKLLQPMMKRKAPAFLETLFIGALESTGQLELSMGTFTDRFNRDNHDIAAIEGMATVMRMQHNFGDELRLRRLLARIEPGYAPVHASIGRLLAWHYGEYERAVEEYRKAITLSPESAGFHAGLARVLAKQGKTQEALEEAHLARKLAPHSFEVRNALVRTLRTAGQVDEARQTALAMADSAPELCQILVSAGDALNLVGEFERAEQVLREAARLGPEHGDAQIGLADALHAQGKLADAEAVARRALQMRKRDVEALRTLAAVLVDAGKEEDALGAYRRIQTVAPRLSAGYAGEVWVRGRSATKELRDVAALQRLAQHAVGLNTRDSSAWRAQALALLLGEDPAGSIKACAQGQATEPPDGYAADLHFLAAMAHGQLGEAAEARREYDLGVAKAAAAVGPKARREELRAKALALLEKKGD